MVQRFTGRIYLTRDRMKSWQDVSWGLLGARVRNIRVSDHRTYVLWAETDRGIMLTRDGGMSWRAAAPDGERRFPARRFDGMARACEVRHCESERSGELLRRTGDGRGDTGDVGLAHFRARLPFS